MAAVRRSDPLELQVLAALTGGASTAAGVASEVGEPQSVVSPILEQSVADLTAVRLDLPGLPTYSLTPKGLALLGGAQEAPGATDPDGARPAGPASMPAGPASMPAEQPEPTGDVHVEDAPREPASAGLPPVVPTGLGPASVSGRPGDPPGSPPRKVRWRHVVYAAGYVLVGLVLLAVQPIIGALAVVAGLALGGYALRPLFATSRSGVSDR